MLARAKWADQSPQAAPVHEYDLRSSHHPPQPYWREEKISKELEVISFNAIQERKCDEQIEKPINIAEENVKNWMLEHVTEMPDDKTSEAPNDQFAAFQKAMRLLLICGQCVGLNPVLGILENEVSKVRFSLISWKLIFSIAVCTAQLIVSCLCMYKLRNSLNINGLGYLSFFLTTCITSCLFVRIATKWPKLLKCITNSGLDKYIDPKIVGRCRVATSLLLGLAVLEHTLSIATKVGEVVHCSTNETFIYETFIRSSSPWLYDLNVPYNTPSGMILQYFNISATINWNYSDIFVVCVSLYLTSVFEQINKKIVQAVDKSLLPSSVWGELREDYTRAARLVRLFDETFSSVILLSFASNLFFICLQLFNILTNGIKPKIIPCPHFPTRSFIGIEQSIYLTYSVVFLFCRFLTVSLVAAGVHSAAQAPATAMYNIRAYAYCKEVQRFLDQVHGDAVALSGLQFFYITKEMVLSVAGTIVTYELVLLQFNSEELNTL